MIASKSLIIHCISHKIKIFITSNTIGYMKNKVNHSIFNNGFTVELSNQSITQPNKYIFHDSIQVGKTIIESG